MSNIRRMLMSQGGGLPPGVVLCEWIKSNNKAYIDSQFYINANSYITIKCEINSVSSTYRSLFGTTAASQKSRYIVRYCPDANINGCFYRSPSKGSSPSAVTGKKQSEVLNKVVTYNIENNDVFITIDESTFKLGSFSSAQNDEPFDFPLFIFATNSSGVVDSVGTDIKIYEFVVKNYDTTVLDLRPCKYNGVACMWDMVEMKPYYNVNSIGSFTTDLDV